MHTGRFNHAVTQKLLVAIAFDIAMAFIVNSVICSGGKISKSMTHLSCVVIVLFALLFLNGSMPVRSLASTYKGAAELSKIPYSPPPSRETYSGNVVSKSAVSFLESGQASTSIYSALLLAWPRSAALGVQTSLRFALARYLFAGTVFAPNDQVGSRPVMKGLEWVGSLMVAWFCYMCNDFGNI